LEGYINAGDLGEYVPRLYSIRLSFAALGTPLLTTVPFFLYALPVLTKEEIQAIDDAGAKGPPRCTFSMLSMSRNSGWTGRKLFNRAGSLALLAGAAVLGMRVYFGVGVDIL